MLITRYKAKFCDSVQLFVHIFDIEGKRYEVTTLENYFPAWCTHTLIDEKLRSLGYKKYSVESLPYQFTLNWLFGSLVFRRI